MARTAMTELQQQIEAVRREAFAAGYAAAMEAIREATSRAAPGAGSAAAARRAPGRDPQSAAGQRGRDGVHLDPSRTGPVGTAQRGRAGRRQQDLASPRRLILSALQQRNDRATRQRVGAFVFGMAGMAA